MASKISQKGNRDVLCSFIIVPVTEFRCEAIKKSSVDTVAEIVPVNSVRTYVTKN
jgi:hypothetical protein